MKHQQNEKYRILCRLFLLILLVSTGIHSLAQEKVQKNQLKFARLLRIVDGYYVDSTNVDKITEDAIVKLLADLDPHSKYISKEDVEKMNEPLKGNFEGIGISFNIYKDTLLVVSVISGGPSEKVGLHAGDRIVDIDGENIAGTGLKNSDVFKMLRGQKGTEVNLKVLRRTEPELLDFKIIRDKIPIFSLDAAYRLNKTTGYIKLNKFAATTYNEFVVAMDKLKQQGIQNLVLDLRGNTGGYLKSAIQISDQFLKDGQLVVYIEGLHEAKQEYRASSKGMLEKGKLVVLVDENSASASEIVSGAVQDWDRGLIVGRRSFGKGLVQKPFMLTDGSMIRLTTAHYHTPSGRCIQKPYEKGVMEYRKDYLNRMSNGEMFNADSIHFDDKLKYKTLENKRNVYGGGGIIPDIFVPMDTSHYYGYLNKLRRKNVVFTYVLSFVDENRDEFKQKYPDFETFNKKFVVTDDVINEIVARGEKEGVKKNEESLVFVKDMLKQDIKAYIARDIFSRSDMYQILNSDDKTLQKALEVIDNPVEYEHLVNSTEVVEIR